MVPAVSLGRSLGHVLLGGHLGEQQGSDFPSCPGRPWNLLEEVAGLSCRDCCPSNQEKERSVCPKADLKN